MRAPATNKPSLPEVVRQESGAALTIKQRADGRLLSKAGEELSAGAAGAAGAGSATLLVLLAQNLSATNPLKSWLVLAAPTAGVLLSTVLLWIRRRLEIQVHRREIQQLFARIQDTLLRAMGDSHISQKHYHHLQKCLEELEKLELSVLCRRINLLLERE